LPDDSNLDWEGEAFKLQQSQLAPQVANSVRNASQVDPDQGARANVLSRQLQIPASSILADPKAAEVRARMASLDAPKLIEQAPVTASTIANQQTANAAHDDIPTLAGIEQNISPPERRSLLDSAAHAPVEAIKGLGGTFNRLGVTVSEAAAIPAIAVDKASSLLSGRYETGAQDWWFRNTTAVGEANQGAFAPAANAGVPEKFANLAGNLIGVLSQALLTGGEGAALPASASGVEALQAAAVHGTKAMAVPALTDATHTMREVYGATGNMDQAVQAAAAQYAASTAGGIVPLNAGGPLLSRMLQSAGSGLLTGEASRQGMNLVLPSQLHQEFDPESAMMNAFAMSIMGIPGEAGRHPYEAIRQTYQDAQRAEQGQKDFAALGQLSQLATGSKWRERDPEAFHQFVERVGDAGALPAVYVDPHVLSQAMDGVGETADRLRQLMPEVAEQMKAGLETGADVRIPVADYATHIAGGAVDQAILPHLKADPEGLTYAQVQEQSGNEVQRMQEIAQGAIQQQSDTAAWHASERQVEDTVRQQLEATGRVAPKAAQAYAALHRDFFSTLADRTGVMPHEAFAEHGANIVGEPLAGGYGQESRGTYSPEDRTISVLEHADLSTFLHESGHFFLDTYERLAQSGPPEVQQDFGELMKWFGKDPETWRGMSIDEKRPFHEQFAKGFERYLMEGKAPTFELSRVFGQFRAWLSRIYQSVTNLGVPLTDEVRGVMDRMLASSEAIRATESARQMVPLFAVKPEGMTDEEWQQYQSAGRDATEQAIADMQARSIRDMRWVSGARTRAIREITREGAEQRRATRIDARREVLTEPVYRAYSFLKGKLASGDRVGEPPKLDQKKVVPEYDSILQAIAKMGGIDEGGAAEHLGVHKDDFDAKPEGLNRRIFRKGGLNADEAVVRLTEHGFLHDTMDLRELEDKVHEELAGNPQYALAHDYRYDDWRPGEGVEHEPLGAGRLDFGSAHQIDPDLARALEAKGMTLKKGGIHPDIVAEIHGYDSGISMMRDLAQAIPPKEAVEARTDQLMLEQHAELSDPKAIARSADQAVHNEARARFVATGLKVLTKSPLPATELVRGAREAADAAVAQTKVDALDPRPFRIAEAKANKAALEAVARDPAAAVQAQRQALLNNQLVRSIGEAQVEIRKAVDYLKRFGKASVRDKLPGEYLEQIDALLSQFDLRVSPVGDPNARAKQSLEQWAESQHAAGFEPQISDWLAAFREKKPYRDLRVEEFRGVVDAVRSIEHIAKETQVVRVAGERMALDEAVAQLKERMAERGERFTKADLVEPPKAATDGYWRALTHFLGTRMRLVDADLKPQEFKFNRYDLHELDGPFRKMLLDRMLDANYRKVDMAKAASDEAGRVGAELGRDWQKALYDLVPNTRLMDPDTGGVLKVTRGRMLGIARHVGNESNFEKLTKGWGWNPQDVWQFLHENMTEKDWRATQAHWDSFDPLWKESEAMIRRLGGVPPPKIPAREIQTKFGTFKGGYSPIDYDPIRSKLAARKGEFDLDPGEKVGAQQVYKATTTSNGSMIARAAGYTDRVNLDFHSSEARIRDTIHDLAYREALLDATKIVDHRGFREAFQGTYGREEYAALQGWLRDIRDMNATDPRNRNFEKAMQYARQGVIMTGIAYRLTTVVKHGSAAALKSLGYLGNAEGAQYFAARVARMGSGHLTEDINGAKEKFAEIRTRMLQMDRDYKEGTRSMYEPESWRAKNDRFGHAMVAWSDALSAVPTAWAAYDLAKTSGVPESMGGTGKPMSEDEAVRYANSIVRQAHGSALEVTRSNFLNARGVKGLFGTIYGFMNNTYGQLGDMLDKSITGGHFNNHPAIAARAMATLVAPAVMAAWASEGLPGKETAKSWASWVAKAITGELAATVPFVRDAWAMIEHDHADQAVAPTRLIADVVKTGKDVGAQAEGKPSKLIQDLANVIGEWAHIGGLGQAGKTLQYLEDVREGRQHPESTEQLVRHAAVGAPPKK